MPTREQAITRANAYLSEAGSGLVAHEPSARPNPQQRMWVISYINPLHPEVTLDGGGLVVPADGPVYPTSSAEPNGPETLGLSNPGEADGLPADWAEVLEAEHTQPYWAELMQFVAGEREAHPNRIFPPQHEVFAALHLTPWEDTRVVILGQDPYPRPGQAHGLAFSVPRGVATPVSLRNIFRELHTDLGVDPPAHGDLRAWAKQGVLLLNTTLTVREGAPGSHQGQGWERVTDAIIRSLSDRAEPVAFVLWGAAAQKKRKLIDLERHRVIAAAHPASYPSAKVPFRGSKPFAQLDTFMRDTGRQPIRWTAPATT